MAKNLVESLSRRVEAGKGANGGNSRLTPIIWNGMFNKLIYVVMVRGSHTFGSILF